MKKFALTNLYGDVIESLGQHDTLAEAEAVAKDEWAKGWEVYTKEVEVADARA